MQLSACSINHLGTASHDVVPANDGIVDQLTAFGLHIETRRDLFSVTLGRYRSLLAYSKICKQNSTTILGTSLELRFTVVEGLGFVINGREAGLSIGRRESLRLRPIGLGESSFRRILFDPRRPEATVVQIDFDENICGVH
ncbi:hypothetical protein KUV62_13965 [Salipiger bermudensis]|uniref:hypothetical protein n=1 Tax=Salipiger bermudensis TaxID=344736 RepID=UPI001C99C6AE|nr:hypothetical protein [Salipiger bermudensis]MBY6005023.1 hypothetical protein [Salipiger bermudensis]